MFQPVQGLWDGPPLGGDVLAEWRGLATVFPDLPVSFSGRTSAKFSKPSRPGAIPQHLWPEPPDQSAPCHPAAPDCQFWQRGQLTEVLLPKCVCAKFTVQESFDVCYPSSLSPLLSSTSIPKPCVVLLQALQVRRSNCEHHNHDPIVWTCHRVMKWIRDIDLKVCAGCHTHPFNFINAKCNQMNWSPEFTFKIKDFTSALKVLSPNYHDSKFCGRGVFLSFRSLLTIFKVKGFMGLWWL